MSENKCCATCGYIYCSNVGKTHAKRCNDAMYWKQKKEQKMYIPTKKCTLKNILMLVHDTRCHEASYELIRILGSLKIWDYSASFWGYTLLEYEEPFKEITKSKKRCNWLEKNGFIKEKIELKPCPFCGLDVTDLSVYSKRGKPNVKLVRCPKCGSSANTKMWNKRS